MDISEMVTNGQSEAQLKELPAALQSLEERVGQRGMLLVPFEPSKLSPKRLEAALNVAETESAELVLLCVRPPAASMRYAQEEERCYSSLRSLQAQLSKRSIPVNIETVTGPVAQFVLDFARRNSADMILIGGEQAVTDDSSRAKLFAINTAVPSSARDLTT